MEAIYTSVSGAAKALGIGRTKVYELINCGRLDTRKLGSRRLVRITSVKSLAIELEA